MEDGGRAKIGTDSDWIFLRKASLKEGAACNCWVTSELTCHRMNKWKFYNIMLISYMYNFNNQGPPIFF